MNAFRTPLCELLGIEVPILQSGMGRIAGPELAAEVCRAGGLGILAGLNVPADTLRKNIARIRELTGGRDAPVLAIGTQQLRGLSPDTWNSYLDSAGYPRESKLPPGYAFASPSPLTERREAPTRQAPAPAAPADVPPAEGKFRF